MSTSPPPPDRWARRMVTAASACVPADRRREWVEQWHAEVWALADNGARAWTQRRFALGAFVDAVVELIHGWREGWTLDGLAGDLRQSLRRTRREPLVSLVAVVVVAAGAAAATSLFALYDATLLRTPPGIDRPSELLQVGRDGIDRFDNFSLPNVRDLADGVSAQVVLAAYGTGTVVAGRAADAQPLDVQFATANYFDVVGVPVQSATGRWPMRSGTPSTSVDEHLAPAAVLSDAYWRSHAAEIEANGHTVMIDGAVVPVAGVAPAGFAGLSIGAPPPAMWLPLSANERATFANTTRGWSWLNVVGRRQSGVSFDAAAAALMNVHRRLSQSYRSTIGDTMTVTADLGFRPADRREAARIFALLMSGAGLVLLVAAANLTGLQLSRALADHRASAIRVSLGASRARLVRAALVDHMWLSMLGGAAAWLLSQWMTTAIRKMLPYDIAVGFDPGPRTLVFAIIAPALLGVAVAVVPSFRSLRPDLSGVMHRTSRGVTSRGRASTVLLVAELALSMALLIGAGLLLRGLSAAARVDPGFDARNVTVVSLRRQPGSRPAAEVRASLYEQMASIAGVQSVGMATRLPIAQSQSTRSLFAADAAYDPDARPVALVSNSVDRGFFDVLRIPLPDDVTWPTAPDRSGTNATAVQPQWPFVVTANAVSRLWPSSSDARVVSNGQVQLRLAATIADIRTRSLSGDVPPAMFVPLGLTDDVPSFVLARTNRSGGDVAAAIRAALAPLSSDVILRDVAPYEPMLVASLSETVVAARLGLPLAAVAVLLAVVGLYSATSRRVVDRRREIGVRLALGAQPASIARAEIFSTLRLCVPAVVSGTALIALATPVLSRVTLGVTWRDPVVVPVAVVVIVGATLLAAYIPARRASCIDPLTACRE